MMSPSHRITAGVSALSTPGPWKENTKLLHSKNADWQPSHMEEL